MAPLPPTPPTDEPGGPFRLGNFPSSVQDAFKKKGSAAWRPAVLEAIAKGITDPRKLANLMFFMQHPERMNAAGVGKLIEAKEATFVKLRVEWILYFTIVTKMLKPSTIPTVFVPTQISTNYEDFVAAPTTGRVTLMVHGRNSDGTGRMQIDPGPWKIHELIGGFRDQLTSFDQMQRAVESLVSGDSLFIANWQFAPAWLRLTAAPAKPKLTTWAELLVDRANDGVKIRVIIPKHPLINTLMTNLPELNTVIGNTAPNQDNFKYIVSEHPHFLGVHHQKFMVARKRKNTVAFCGGLDISYNRAPQGKPSSWHLGFVWHDVVAKLEGLIAHDIERQFVAHWNRDRTKSKASALAGWKAFEKLAQQTPSAADKSADLNQHPVQMLRTVAVGPLPADIRRDDIWRAYFRLIGRATRFIYLENQYFYEPALADAIVKQVESQPELIVMVMSGTGTDDIQVVDTTASADEQLQQKVLVQVTQNQFALRLQFFKRLLVAPLVPDRLRVYTLNYRGGITHTKLILVDDEALSVGSANANPRGFVFDTEVNVVLDHAETARGFREALWAHNLGIAPAEVAKWRVSQFFENWNRVAQANLSVEATPEKMVGEGVIPFRPIDPKNNPRYREGKRAPIILPKGLDIGLMRLPIDKSFDEPDSVF